MHYNAACHCHWAMKSGILGKDINVKCNLSLDLGSLMDFWDSYRKRMVGDFSGSRIWLGTSVRKNASLRAVEEFSREVELNTVLFQRYDTAHRYVIAKDVTHDLLFLAYDVNSRDALAARITRDVSSKELTAILSRLRKVKEPNMEFRLIGLQNGGQAQILSMFDKLRRRMHGILVEVDLFGANVRHVALDTKTGMTYNILLLNRIYRAGELSNTLSREDFESKLGQLSFK